jgi:hypothetical protein
VGSPPDSQRAILVSRAEGADVDDDRSAGTARGGRGQPAQAQRPERGRADDAVGGEAAAPLEAPDRATGLRPELAVGRDAQLALHRGDVVALLGGARGRWPASATARLPAGRSATVEPESRPADDGDGAAARAGARRRRRRPSGGAATRRSEPRVVWVGEVPAHLGAQALALGLGHGVESSGSSRRLRGELTGSRWTCATSRALDDSPHGHWLSPAVSCWVPRSRPPRRPGLGVLQRQDTQPRTDPWL